MFYFVVTLVYFLIGILFATIAKAIDPDLDEIEFIPIIIGWTVLIPLLLFRVLCTFINKQITKNAIKIREKYTKKSWQDEQIEKQDRY